MILDKNIDINARFSQNIRIYNQKINNKNDKDAMVISISILEDILDQLLQIKLFQVSQTAQLPEMTYSSKVDLCYKMELIKSALRRTLQILGELNDSFAKTTDEDYFGNLEVQTNIIELCKINENDIFNLILNLINSDPLVEENYQKAEDLVEHLGWSGALKFICSIISASLVEALVELK
jgi:hypothetical protein